MGAGLRPAGQDYHPEPRGKAPVGTQQKQLLLPRAHQRGRDGRIYRAGRSAELPGLVARCWAGMEPSTAEEKGFA